MNKDLKIVQERTKTMIGIVAQIPTRMTMGDGGWSPTEVAHRLRGICDEVIAALDNIEEAQANRKVLTDDKIQQMSEQAHFERLHTGDESDDPAIEYGEGYRQGLKDARDNGYLAPAPVSAELVDSGDKMKAVWRKMVDNTWQYLAPGYAVYGTVAPKGDKWEWSARVMLNCRSSFSSGPTTGIATSLEGAKRITELVLYETGTITENNTTPADWIVRYITTA